MRGAIEEGSNMSLKEELKSLVHELDLLHNGSPWPSEVGMPDFVTARNGSQRFFARNAREALQQLSITLYQNRPKASVKMEPERFEQIVRQAVADMHAEGAFHGFDESNQKSSLSNLKSLVDDRLAGVSKEHTHYFPAWTLGMEREAPFSIGPVTFFNRNDWIDSVDFPSQAKDHYLNQPEANYRWKEFVKEALRKPNDGTPLDGLAGTVYGAISQCPALAKVTIRGYELKFSRKLARLVCKTALDAISLGFGAPECFQQQALQDERLPPFGNDSVVETNGFLWLPGVALGKRIPSLSPKKVSQSLKGMENILAAFSSILEGLVEPSSHRNPKLSNRWATALDWFGEGSRESNDAIALAKLATCLDVLCCGGKYVGIRDMVVHLTGASSDTQVIRGVRPRTLGDIVKDIYDHGRSQILHGAHYDRLESFSTERQHAAYVARIVLIECALRLKSYSGDEDKAFRTIARP